MASDVKQCASSLTNKPTKLLDYLVAALAIICGVGAVALFAAAGSLHIVRFGWRQETLLLWDGLLSFAFFLQHSGMVRRPFRARLAKVVPPHYHGAVYSIASGVVLTLVVVLWQSSSIHLVQFRGLTLWATRLCSLLAVATFVWSAHALRSFDPLGLNPVKAHLCGIPEKRCAFVVRGPYRWVRHPLYFCILVMFWTSPDVTADRLLFNILWTAWIWVGSRLEETDLVADFGDSYRDYRRRVPMLIPWRGPVAS